MLAKISHCMVLYYSDWYVILGNVFFCIGVVCITGLMNKRKGDVLIIICTWLLTSNVPSLNYQCIDSSTLLSVMIVNQPYLPNDEARYQYCS